MAIHEPRGEKMVQRISTLEVQLAEMRSKLIKRFAEQRVVNESSLACLEEIPQPSFKVLDVISALREAVQ
jgi:hypothetical protein